jgi:hypothetical protein
MPLPPRGKRLEELSYREDTLRLRAQTLALKELGLKIELNELNKLKQPRKQ